MYDEQRVTYLLTQNKTPEVVDELLRLNYGLLVKQLMRFYLVEDPDGISYGYEALYNAIVSYKPTQGSKFSTYASVCIYNALGCVVRRNKTQIVVNTSFYEQQDLIDTFESAYTADSALLSEDGVEGIKACILKGIETTHNAKHKQMIQLWVSSDFTMSHKSIADEVGCSQTYVSQVIKKFKNKLEVLIHERNT